MTNIASIRPIGRHSTRDLEVDHPDHQFYLANGVLTSNSHAVAYAIDSLWCAWLLTHYEAEWISSYVESMSNNPDDKSKAFSEVRRLGYQITSIDVNYAGAEWKVLPGKKLMPSLLSCKGIGQSALEEIEAYRPYKSLQHMLYKIDGSWKHSKFNKRALEALVNVGALDSLDCVGPDKIFSSYAHAYHVLIDHADAIKKSTKREPQRGWNELQRIAAETHDTIAPWTRRELAEKYVEHFAYLDVGQVIDPHVLEIFESRDVKSVDHYEDVGIYWYCVIRDEPTTTRNGKPYLRLFIQGPSGKTYRVFCWGWDGVRRFEPYAVCFSELKNSDFGLSTQMNKIRELT